MTAIGTFVHLEPGEHVVQFYAGDGDLVATVGSHLAGALEDGDVAVVAATAAHRAGFAATMSAAGVDVPAARLSGHLLEVDAADLLEQFMMDGVPVPADFDRAVGGLVRRAGRGGHRVRAYGEMVALLWDAGQIPAAVALEQLWNDLGERLAFSLFCAYPTHLVGGADNADARARVCHLHSSVVGTPHQVPVPLEPVEAAKRFPAHPASSGAVRRFVTTTVHGWGCDDLIADATIVTTELATNALRHALSDFEVTEAYGDGILRMAVRDFSRAEPMTRRSTSVSSSGRGLVLVAGLASSWGHTLLDDGKLVWAEFDRGRHSQRPVAQQSAST
ncbi:MAG: MEDS domain-containing protein [Acidimicrobiales bacterium]